MGIMMSAPRPDELRTGREDEGRSRRGHQGRPDPALSPLHDEIPYLFDRVHFPLSE